MAICTKCGTIMDKEDMKTHVCNPAEIPDKNKPISFGTTKAELI
jgi:hypothetical protein